MTDDAGRRTPGGARYRSLRDSAALRAFVDNLREAIYIANARGEILDCNPAFLELAGVVDVADLRDVGLSDLVADPERRMAELERLDREGSVREFELELVRRDGSRRTVLDTTTAVRDPESGETYYHGILVDITQRKRLEDQLRDESVRDPLTGCFNRRYLHQLAERFDADAAARWGCVYIDIDHFKQYNEVHGHRMGDTTLVRMSRFLMRQVRAEEAVVRVGGDEFLIVLDGATLDGAELVAKRLQLAALRTAPVPFSLGWAVRDGAEPFHQTMHRADTRLLQVRVIERAPTRAGAEEG